MEGKLMKKFIILGLVVLFVFLSAQGLYKVKKPARFSSWIKIGGDFIPIWDGRSNLGHPSYWFDSLWLNYGQFNYVQADSGFTINGDMWHFNKARSYYTDGLPGADTSSIFQTGSSLQFNTNNKFEFVGNVEIDYGAFLGSQDIGQLTWYGYRVHIDENANDSLPMLTFGNTDTLKWDSIPEAFTLTAPLTIDGDLTVSGETNLGDAATDTVTVLGAMKLTTAVIDSAAENGAQDTLFVYVGGGRVYCLPLAP